MNWKRWLVVGGLGLLALKAPHTVMALADQFGRSVATFWDAMGMH